MIPRRKKRERMGVRAEAQFRCDSHLAWIRGCRCAIERKAGHACGGKTEAAHVRTGTDGGLSVKPSDFWAIPLCSDAHTEQHQIGEAAFERRYGIDMKDTATKHAAMSPHRSKWMERQ